jgi:hypothetical protein
LTPRLNVNFNGNLNGANQNPARNNSVQTLDAMRLERHGRLD